MSDRVEQERAARQAQDAERLQKRIDKESRDHKAGEANRESFARLVKGKEQSADGAKKNAERQTSESRQGEQTQKTAQKQTGEAERAARMARGGVVQNSRVMEQAKSFSQVLGAQTSQTQQADGGRVERRDAGAKKDRVEREDRDTDVRKAEQRKDADVEQAKVEAREQARVNAAIDGGGKGDTGGNSGRGDDGTAQALKKAGGAAPVEGAKAAHEVKQIPPELLEKLVNAVYLAVNKQGMKELQMEMKDGPLKGGFLRISANGGKVALRFEGLEPDQKRLLESSKGELMRRLQAKGLSLDKLDVG